MKKQVYYHTRHIPIEHILLDHPMGKSVRDNLLCDSIDPPCSDKLKDYGMDIIETRLVWNELEPEPGKYDFSRFDKTVEKIKKRGFGLGVFPWFQHPPKWYEDGVRLKCPIHDEESTLISLWDSERILEIYDRLYGELAKRYGDVIDFIYVGIYSDYGEVCMPLGVTHYYFSPKHSCPNSMWDGDVLAQESKREALEKANAEGVHEDIAYMNWYTQSVMDFTDKVCAIFRKHFPTVRAALPIGCASEALIYGQVKSLSAKIAAKYNIIARWTGWCLSGVFESSHITTRRVSSAAKFYGADFGLETPLYLSKENAPHAMFEVMSNNTELIHNDPGNIFRAYDVYKAQRYYKEATPFLCDKAVFFPLEGEMLSKDYQFFNDYRDETVNLRRHCDFEVADHRMLKDGYKNTIIFTPNAPLLKETAEIIKREGLDTVYIKNAPPVIIENGEKFIYGTPIVDFSAFGKWNGIYQTKLSDGVVSFDANTLEISYK